jgi:hypothetical protein
MLSRATIAILYNLSMMFLIWTHTGGKRWWVLAVALGSGTLGLCLCGGGIAPGPPLARKSRDPLGWTLKRGAALQGVAPRAFLTNKAKLTQTTRKFAAQHV